MKKNNTTKIIKLRDPRNQQIVKVSLSSTCTEEAWRNYLITVFKREVVEVEREGKKHKATPSTLFPILLSDPPSYVYDISFLPSNRPWAKAKRLLSFDKFKKKKKQVKMEEVPTGIREALVNAGVNERDLNNNKRSTIILQTLSNTVRNSRTDCEEVDLNNRQFNELGMLDMFADFHMEETASNTSTNEEDAEAEEPLVADALIEISKSLMLTDAEAQKLTSALKEAQAKWDDELPVQSNAIKPVPCAITQATNTKNKNILNAKALRISATVVNSNENSTAVLNSQENDTSERAKLNADDVPEKSEKEQINELVNELSDMCNWFEEAMQQENSKQVAELHSTLKERMKAQGKDLFQLKFSHSEVSALRNRIFALISKCEAQFCDCIVTSTIDACSDEEFIGGSDLNDSSSDNDSSDDDFR